MSIVLSIMVWFVKFNVCVIFALAFVVIIDLVVDLIVVVVDLVVVLTGVVVALLVTVGGDA